MEENTEENIVENMVDNMVDNMGEVLLAAKNQRSSARGRDPEIRPIRSSEERYSWLEGEEPAAWSHRWANQIQSQRCY